MKFKTFELVTLAFGCLSLVIINWFNGWYYIYQTDSLFYINPEKRINDSLYFWKDSHSLGYASPGFNLAPFYYVQSIFYKLFINFLGDSWKSIVLSEAIMYYMALFLSMLSAFVFFKELYRMVFKSENYNRLSNPEILGIATLAILYAINIHTATYIFWRFFTWTLFWPSLPLISYLYLKYIKARESFTKLIYILLVTLIFITPLGGGFSQAGFVLLFFSLSILTIFLGIIFGNVIKVAKKFAIFILLTMLLLSWIIVPQFFFAHSTYSFAASTYASNIKQLEYASRYTTILNILRFMGYYVFYSTYGNLSYPYIWAEAFKQNFQTLTCMYPILLGITLLALCIEKNQKVRLAFLSLVLLELLLIVIMKGSAEPFPETGYILLKVNSVFFRHPYDRFIHIFFFYYCILLLYLIRIIVNKFEYNTKIVFSILIMVLLLDFIVSYSLFTGEVIHPLDKVYLKNTDYLELDNVFTLICNNTDYCRILVTPFSVYGEYSYNISGKINHVILKPLIYNFVPSNIKIIQFGYSPLEKKAFIYLNNLTKTSRYWDFIDVVRLLGIRYIVLQKDFTTEYVTKPWFIGGNEKFMSMLERMSLIEKIWEGRNVIIYKVKDHVRSIMYPIDKGIEYTLLKSVIDKDANILIRADDIARRYSNLQLIVDLKSLSGTALSLNPTRRIDYAINISYDGFYDIAILGRGKINITIDHKYSFIVNGEGILRTYLGRGQHILSLSAAPIASFEFQKDFDLRGIDLLNKKFYVFLANDSLCLTTNVSNQWSYLYLPPIPITQGVYEIIIKLKYINADRTHVVLRAYNSSISKWQYYETIVPGQSGTNNWQIFRKRVPMLSDDIIKVFVSINAGGVKNRLFGNATTCINYIRMYYDDNRIYAIMIKPLKNDNKYSYSNVTLKWKYVNPTLWLVHAYTNKSFMLVFAEAYDSLWEARIYRNGRLVDVVKPVPVYGVLNGFWINTTGNVTIVIRYVPQDWFELGLKISGVTFVLCVLYLVWDWRRPKGDRWAVKLEERVRRMLRCVLKRRFIEGS